MNRKFIRRLCRYAQTFNNPQLSVISPKNLTDDQKADLKKKFRREEELLKSENRIAEIAYDIGKHFKDNFRGTGKKGQLACSSKENAIRYKRLLDEYGDVTSEVIMSSPDTRENHTDIDESKVPEVQTFWKSLMDRYSNEKNYLKSVISSYTHSSTPEILIVVDKLLTGFDAPRNSVLYLDKRLKDHNILQAIARVNRIFEGKDSGLVVDYRGIFGALNDAIDTYAALEEEGFDKEDIEGTIVNTDEVIQELPQKLSNVWEIFKEVGNKSDIEAMQRHLEPEDIRQRFYKTLRLFSNILQLALANARFQDNAPQETVSKYKNDLKMFLNLRSAVKQRYGEVVDYSAYEKQIRNIVNKHIGADEVKIIIEQVDIFAEEQFARELEAIEGDAAKADTIASRIRRTITEKMEEDPTLYKRLSELIEDAIKAHRDKRLTDAEYLAKMHKTLDETRGKATDSIPDKLKDHDDAKAYYGIILSVFSKLESFKGNTEAVCADIAIKFEEIITGHKIRDWIRKQDVQNKMTNDLEDHLFSIKGRYEIEMDYDQIDTVLEQVMMTAKRRDHEI